MFLLKTARVLAGLLLVPVCVALSRTVWQLVVAIQPQNLSHFPPAAIALCSGFTIWLLVYFFLPAPVRTYVLAHELTHALWGLLMGARVSGMKVAKDKGSVTLSKTNFLITLAPYFFPLYTVIVIALYYITSIFYPVEPYFIWWLALVGFSWGFHLTFTISSLAQHQTDIQEYGYVFSYVIIYLFNVLGIALWIVMVSSVTLEQFILFFKKDLIITGSWIWNLSVQVHREAIRRWHSN